MASSFVTVEASEHRRHRSASEGEQNHATASNATLRAPEEDGMADDDDGSTKSKSWTNLSGARIADHSIGQEEMVCFENEEFTLSMMSASPSVASSLSKHLDSSVFLKSPENLAPRMGCEMCANYEIQLQQLQESERSLKQQLGSAQHLADRSRMELSVERLQRSELETKMMQLTNDANSRVKHISSSQTDTISRFEDLEAKLDSQLLAAGEEFSEIREEQEALQKQKDQLQEHYDRLLGRHREEAAKMQQEAIDLPQTIDELQLFVLQLREELIESRAAKQHLEETQQGELAALKEQLLTEQDAKTHMQENLMEEINNLRTELAISRSQISELQQQVKRGQELERQMVEYQTTIGDLETKLQSLQTEKGEIEFELNEHRKKAHTLHHELDNSEAVQRDFVKLSQSLQIELEKIRQAEQEVRWQHEDDVLHCNGCRQQFGRFRVKVHCRHCGRIFCDACLTKSVASGPQRRPAKVCDICHTLLVRDTAPYFSEHVPNAN